MTTYRELIVWQKSMTLVELVYQITKGFPKEEIYGLTSQLRRAAVSIPSNIAEGNERHSTKEYRQFLGIARGSLAEVETQIELAQRIQYLSMEQKKETMQLTMEVGKMLNAILTKLAPGP